LVYAYLKRDIKLLDPFIAVFERSEDERNVKKGKERKKGNGWEKRPPGYISGYRLA